jgi:prephenate dehydratase
VSPGRSPAAGGNSQHGRVELEESKTMTERYAYLGPEGTFTEAALAELDPAACEHALPCPSIPAALDAVRAGEAGRALVPIENSVEGAVTVTLDELAAGPDLVIVAELLLPVRFALLAREGTALADVKTVGGHPQAQPQCRRWLAAHLPDAEWHPVSSNAEAARQVADGQLGAALAGAFAAPRYRLAVLADAVSDVPGAVTRFVVVSRPGPVPARTGADRTSLVAFLREDHPGALMELLTEFAVRGVNLTRIESRPTGDGLGRYCFSIDCEGHLDDARVGEALMGLRRVCAQVRFLGSYPRRDGGRSTIRPGTSDAEFAQAAAWLARLRYGRVLTRPSRAASRVLAAPGRTIPARRAIPPGVPGPAPGVPSPARRARSRAPSAPVPCPHR